MNLFKTIWGLFFRLFPCPTRVGLYRAGHPNHNSPVLVTCNFYLTVRRLLRVLNRASIDAWLLAADSKGVNVWCAAGAEEFNTRTVISAIKTSGVAGAVNHRELILPPLGAPGVSAVEVGKRTGWSVRWGPVRAEDLPRYLANPGSRDEEMMRVTYNWRERLDTALGSLFPFYFLGALGMALFYRSLLVNYLVVGALAFLLFFLACPWIPGRRGINKVLIIELLLAALWVVVEWFKVPVPAGFRANMILAMVMFLIYGLELGGLASNMPSDLDPFLARLGVKAVGNIYFAGAVRSDLLNGDRRLIFDRGACIGCYCCHEICPQDVWGIDNGKAALLNLTLCTACRACLVQCPSGAIQAPRIDQGDKNCSAA